jgi:hypothetical protein
MKERTKFFWHAYLLKIATVTYENFNVLHVQHSKSNTWSVTIEDCHE